MQTVWLTVIAIAIGRTRDKWPTEGTLVRLDHALAAAAPRPAGVDVLWVSTAIACLIYAFAWGWAG